MKQGFVFSVFVLLVPHLVWAVSSNPLVKNMEVSAAVDILTQVNDSSELEENNRFDVRSAELLFYGAIDPLFDGYLAVAAHQEGGESLLEIEEAFISSSRLIPRSRFRIGQFFLGVGRLNQFHRHDWPFTMAPRVHETFFDEEAALDTGVEYSYLLPTRRYWDVTLGVTNGYCFGHCHTLGDRPQTPLHYLRPVTFFETDSGGVQLGWSYLSRTDHQGERMQLIGMDLTYKAREGRVLRWLMQSEWWTRALESDELSRFQSGGYVYLQRGLTSQWSVGARVDLLREDNLRFPLTNEPRENLDYDILAQLAFQSTEFATWRLSLQRQNQTRQGVEDDVNHVAFLQWVYILGAHPAHDF